MVANMEFIRVMTDQIVATLALRFVASDPYGGAFKVWDNPLCRE